MKRWIRNLVSVRDTPEALARGLSIGFFFGVSLFWGLQILLALLFSQLLGGNKVVAAAMTAVSNPLTNLPLYAFCYYVGHFALGGNDDHPDFSRLQSFDAILELGPDFLLRMLLGSTVVGMLGAVAVYFSSQRLLARLHSWFARPMDGGERTERGPIAGRARRGSIVS